MRRTLALAALALSAAASVAPAAALPPDCDHYSDRPCINFCEIYHDHFAPLVEGLC